jgi:hypothetical protein
MGESDSAALTHAPKVNSANEVYDLLKTHKFLGNAL